MIKGNFIFTIVLLIFSIVLFIATLGYPWKAMVFPLIAISTALILLLIQTGKDILFLKKEKMTEKEEGKKETLGYKHLVIGLWMVGIVMILWIVGFMATVIVLPFLYLKLNKESWKLSIVLSFCCGVFFYLLFGLALKMPLYPGIIGAALLG